MLEIITTKTFEKDYARMVRQGKKLDKIKKVIGYLKEGVKLDQKYRDINYLALTKVGEIAMLNLIGY